MNSFEKVYVIVRKIPKGKVVTYKQVSELCGISPRVVGFALHANKNPKEVPCHRVVNIEGKLANGYAFGGKGIQEKLLRNENVKFLEDERVDFPKSQYFFNKV